MSPGFDPIFPAHAIERCGITITFKEPLPEKAFDRAVGRAREVLLKKGFQQAVQPVGISLDVLTGKVGPVVGSRPQSFNLPDQSASLFITPNAIIWQNSRYVRWAPFVGQFQDFASPIIAGFLESVSFSAVRIEYWDRFNWTGTWEDFDPAQLIRPDARAVVKEWREWHSHAGWFEPLENLRRLTNVNVDVGDGGGGKPSVLVYTMMQDEPGLGGNQTLDPKTLDEAFLFARLEVIHRDLKKQLGMIINDAMIKRISLTTEERA